MVTITRLANCKYAEILISSINMGVSPKVRSPFKSSVTR